ncbi:MAG: CHASE2 domain-containing protein [Oscillatoria sp. SIO1A7]|nr:CHASE2 domain-containing protein [Oscillatoria sp. SIO1A7]
MGKLVVLKIISGDSERGFSVALQIGEEGRLPTTEQLGDLPGCPDVLENYQQWQQIYKRLPYLLRLDRPDTQETSVSKPEKCRQAAGALRDSLNQWLESESFRPLKERLLQKLPQAESIRFAIQTEDLQLQQLPWHQWKFFEEYSRLETVLSLPNLDVIEKTNKSKSKVKILAILGNSEKIDTFQDGQFLENLPDAEVRFLPSRSREEISDNLWLQPWDVLFFAGHSSTEGKSGRIAINKDDNLTIDELKNCLKQAIEGGLQLAIFNSCDGLGLARDLAELHIPQTIVMREPVPDEVAQHFLRNFLEEYALKSLPLHLALRRARERLQGLEKNYPCASWLPVIYQNPAEIPPTWQQLRDGIQPKKPTSIFQQIAYPIGVALVVAVGILGIRQAGLLQPFELKAFDILMKGRPLEPPDDRLLVIEVTERDLRYQQETGMERQGSLADAALAQILAKLKPHQPRAIGLDIYRDFPVKSDLPELVPELQSNPNFFAICKGEDPTVREPGIAPPPEIPSERVGFSDVVRDDDGILRRHLWYANFNQGSACESQSSLSLLLALHYLEAEGTEPEISPEFDLLLGKATLKSLQKQAGGYQNLDHYGYQMLLNYRNTGTEPIARSVTLKDFLDNPVNSDWVKDKIVLIGVTAGSKKDFFPTPYSATQQQEDQIPGVFLQAQMVSQIISAASRRRPLLGVWPQWGDNLWIFGWSLAGGILAWRLRSFWLLLPCTTVAIGFLYGTCLFLLIQGTWVPLVPSALALSIAGIVVVAIPRVKAS